MQKQLCILFPTYTDSYSAFLDADFDFLLIISGKNSARTNKSSHLTEKQQLVNSSNGITGHHIL